MVDKIKQIKHSRLKPEEIWFLNLITDLEEFKLNKYPNSIFYKKNDLILFEHDFKNKILYVGYKNIWSVIKNKYNYGEHDTQSFIKKIIEEYLNWYDFVICNSINYNNSIWLIV